jgi:uncharacterized protein (TIGR03089 family)
MTTPAIDLMASLRSGNSTAPRLTWYGPEAERVELSGKVLDNWVAKTSNLLQDELDAAPGMRLALDLPAHWKAMVWALAGWQLGLETVLTGDAADFLATAAPDAVEGKYDAVVAVALPALAMRWDGGLPPGCLDYAAEVRSHGDVFMQHADPDPSACAIVTSDGRRHLHRDLLDRFAAHHEEGVRLGAWRSGGSVVLTHPDVKDTGKLLAAERIHGS